MDPVVTIIISLCMSLLFLLAAIQKLRAPAVFRASLEDYGLIPTGLTGFTSVCLIVIELAAAIAVLFSTSRNPGLTAMAFLLILYSVAIGINLFRGRREIDCGCGGPDSSLTLSWWLVIRNGIFTGLVLLGMSQPALRPLNWLDLLTIVLAVLVASGLYAGISQLLVQAPRMAELKNEI